MFRFDPIFPFRSAIQSFLNRRGGCKVTPFSLSQSPRTVYFDAMKLLHKHPIPALAAGFGVLGILLILTARFVAQNSFVQNLLLNLGPEVLGIALTVGFVDFLLEHNREYELMEATVPRVVELATTFTSLTTAETGLPVPPT